MDKVQSIRNEILTWKNNLIPDHMEAHYITNEILEDVLKIIDYYDDRNYTTEAPKLFNQSESPNISE